MFQSSKSHTKRRLGRCAQPLIKRLARGVISLVIFAFSETSRQLVKALVDRMTGSGKVIEVALPELGK